MQSRHVRLGSALVFSFVLVGAPVIPVRAQSPAASSTATLPSAKSILDRHIEAVGGRQALAKRSSVHVTATQSVAAQGLSGNLEIFSARPNKQLLKMTMPGIGEILEGFDGNHAWSMNPMTGPTLTTGEEREQKALDADFEGTLNAAARYTSIETLEKTTFDGRDCYKVKLVRKDGVEDIDFYDVATGLKAGSINTRKNPMGTITATTTLHDYKKFGDLLQPTVMKQQVMGTEIVTTITSVEYDKVDPSVFELPAQIKALIKQ